MKKIILAASFIAVYGIVSAQTPEDALRYSWLQTTGTARSQAIGNANGALGGEISTIFSNPANIGFYKSSDFVISGGLNFLNNNTAYYGQSTKETKAAGFLGTSGVVFGKPSFGKGSVKSSALGIGINRTADFNNRVVYQTKASAGGELVRTSMADYFIEDIVATQNPNPYGSELALNTGWVKEDKEGKLSSPAVDLAEASGLEQMQTISTYGGITEIAIAGAANLNEKLYIGGSIGLPVLRYGANRRYTEQDPNSQNTSNGFDYAYFEDDLITSGVGFNMKAGVVVKANDNLRLGFAAHTPTFYSMSDSYVSFAEVNLDKRDAQTSKSRELVYDYNLQTPYKLMGSFSLLFGDVNDVASQKGFISGDVEYVNYTVSAFRTTRDDNNSNDGYFKNLNGAIDNAYKGAVNGRLGAELKFNPVAVRFGGAYYGNPYKNLAGEKGEIVQATGGLGYRNKGFFIDLGYVHSFSKDVVFPYRLTNMPFSPANIKSNNSRVVLTLGFKI